MTMYNLYIMYVPTITVYMVYIIINEPHLLA